MGVSIVMGVPQNEWFIRKKPIENGWFRGTPIYGNPHVSLVWCGEMDTLYLIRKEKNKLATIIYHTEQNIRAANNNMYLHAGIKHEASILAYYIYIHFISIYYCSMDKGLDIALVFWIPCCLWLGKSIIQLAKSHLFLLPFPQVTAGRLPKQFLRC